MTIAENRYLSANYGPVAEELTLTDLPVTGRVPDALEGRYLRNGPNPVHAPTKPAAPSPKFRRPRRKFSSCANNANAISRSEQRILRQNLTLFHGRRAGETRDFSHLFDGRQSIF